jgi:two-component system, OmpR family, sensor kinase
MVEGGRQGLLQTLERLLEISGTEASVALATASDLVAEALRADKVDVFVYDPNRDSLVALGSSHQPLSALQKRHGLDILPVSNGGRVVHVYRTASTFLTGALESDPEELRGVKEVLHIRSKLGVPLYVGEKLRGVLMIASQAADFWTPPDVVFAESVARWIGVVAHRAELTAEIARNAVEQGRRAAAEELVTVLAHDLRNHLAPLDLRLRALRHRLARDERSADVPDVDAALRSVARIEQLVSDMLDVARIDQGMFSMKAQLLPLLPLLRETAGALATPDHPIVVEESEEMVVVADPLRLRQCLENLLANAIKHSPKGGEVTIAAARERRDSELWATVDVIDQGPGVPEHVLPHLFERFVKASRSSGLGLGLYLAKRIVVMHGGDLTVESRPGEGARFRLRLPCYDE